MKAKISNNGNPRSDFVEAYKALIRAQKALDDAARILMSDVANGRNYQHLADGDDAVIEDRRRIKAAFIDMRGKLGSFASEIVEIVK
jgi:hypothetical protein